MHHGMVLGKLSEQLQLVDFIPGGVGSTVCWMLIQTCARFPFVEGRQKYLQPLGASEYAEQKAAENLATKYYNQLFKKKVKIVKSFAGREMSLSLTFQRA